MSIHIEIHKLLDWIRMHLIQGFKEDSMDVYTDEYSIAYDELMKLAALMRAAERRDNMSEFVFYKDKYMEIFAEASLEIITGKIEEVKDSMEECNEYNNENLPMSEIDYMATEQVSSMDYAHNYWASLLDNVPIVNFSHRSKLNISKDLSPFVKSFSRGNNEPATHTDNCYNSPSGSYYDHSPFSQTQARGAGRRPEEIAKGNRASDPLSASIADFATRLECGHSC